MQINKAALEIFDFTSSLAVYSEHELKVGDQAIQDYIANHVARLSKTQVLEQVPYMMQVHLVNSWWSIKRETSSLSIYLRI